MISELKNSGKYNITILLALMSLFCFLLSLFRIWFSKTNVFIFLNWNLFLAFIPWMVSTIISLNRNYQRNKFALFFLLLAWLVFFPNSPYMLTDLFHLRVRQPVPVWFDLVVILSFAWTALVYGFISLAEIEKLLSTYVKSRMATAITIAFLFVSSFGIYIGRYLRWNSWDIVKDPFPLMAEVADRFVSPFSHPRTWGLTILMGVLLNMMFWTFKFFTSDKIIAVQNRKR
jgi:uncharacterized membrane protein